MRYSEVGFRGVNHQYVCFPINVFRGLLDDFPGHLKSDSVLTYGYVDHENGMSFEVLACGKKDGTKYNFYKGNPDVHVVARVAHVEDVSFDVLDAYATQIPEIFREKVEWILENYENYDLMNLRVAQAYDPFRDPRLVDEISVLLKKEGNEPETLPARLEMKGIACVIATLLEEPSQNFGCHAGDPIGVVVTQEDSPSCVAELDKDLILSRSQLADGKILKKAIHDFNSNPSDETMNYVFEILRDSDLWVPANEKDGDRIDIDLLREGENYFLPAFSQPEEMGEYGDRFTPVKERMYQLVEFSKNDAFPLSAIVINPFGETFIVEKRFFDRFSKNGSHLPN